MRAGQGEAVRAGQGEAGVQTEPVANAVPSLLDKIASL